MSKGVYATWAIFGILVFALVFFVLQNAGFWSSSDRTQDVGRRTPSISVVATIYPYGFLAERIGGDLVSVRVMTPPGAEPHDYEPTPRDIMTTRSSRLFLLNGEGIDAWAERIEPDLADSGVETLTLSSLAERTEATTQDPHVWIDPLFMIAATRHIADALVRIDPTNTATYRANAEALTAELQDLDAAYRTGLADCDVRDIIVSHDAFARLSSRYGFTAIGITGFSPDEEPSAKRLGEIVDLTRQKGIRVIFFETLISPKMSETLAAETGANVLPLNPLEGLAEAELDRNDTYLSVMRENLTNLRTAMVCR